MEIFIRLMGSGYCALKGKKKVPFTIYTSSVNIQGGQFYFYYLYTLLLIARLADLMSIKEFVGRFYFDRSRPPKDGSHGGNPPIN